jgi:hypothetical protein
MGFSFGAKDAGLLVMQGKVKKNFDAINKALDVFTEKSKGFTGVAKQMLGAMDPKPVAVMEDAIADLGDTTTEVTKSAVKGMEDLGDTRKPTDDLESAVDRLGKTLGGVMRNQFGKLPGMLGRAKEKVGDLSSGIAVFGKMLTQLKMQTFLQSLEQLKSSAGGLPGVFKEGINLTTGLESQMASMGKTARAMGANFGMTGKELKDFTGKASSMAYSLNTDVNTAAMALRAFKEAGDELRVLGFEGAKDVARFTEAFGVNADTMRNQTMRMKRELGLSYEQIDDVVDSLVKMGQETGDVGKAMEDLPKILDLIARRKALGDTPEELARFAKQIPGLARGFFEFSQNSDEARERAIGLAEALTANRTQFQDMLAGEGAQLPTMFKEMGIAFGDSQMALDALKQGPAEFAVAINKAVGRAGGWAEMLEKHPDQVNFIRARMDKAFGDPKMGQEFMLFLQHSGDNIGELMKGVLEAELDLGKLGREAHSTGLTLQDSFQRSVDTFVVGFRKHGRPAAREFVRETSKEFKRFNKMLSDTVKEGGPMGMLVKKMSEANSIGVQAFIPKTLRPMTTLFGQLTGELAPAATALGAMGLKLNMLASPWTAVAVGAGLVVARFADLRMQGKSTSEALDIMVDDVKKGFSTAWRVTKDVLGKITDKIESWTQTLHTLVWFVDLTKGWETWWEEFFDSFIGGAKSKSKSMVSRIGGVLSGIWDEIQNIFDPKGMAKTRVGKIVQSLVYIFTKVFGSLVKVLQKRLREVDWGALFETVGKGFVKGGNKLNEYLKMIPWGKIFSTMFDAVGGVIQAVGDPRVGMIVGQLAKSITSRVAILGEAFVTLFEEALTFLEKVDMATALAGVTSNVRDVIFQALEGLLPLLQGLLSKVPGFVERGFALLFDFLKDVPGHLAGLISSMGEKLRDMLPQLIPYLMDAAVELFEWMFIDMPMKGLARLPEVVAGAFQLVWSGISWFGDALVGLFSGLLDWVDEKWPGLGSVIRPPFEFLVTVWDRVKAAAGDFFGYLTGWATLMGQTLARVFDQMPEFFEFAWKDIQAYWAEHGEEIKQWGRDLVDWIFGPFDEMATWPYDYIIKPLVEGEGIKSTLVEAGKSLIGHLVEGMVGAPISIWTTLYNLLQDALNLLPFSPAKEGPLAGSALTDAGAGIVNGILEGLEAAWGAVTDFISTALEGVVSTISSALSGGGRIASDTVAAITGELQGGRAAWTTAQEAALRAGEYGGGAESAKRRRSALTALSAPKREQLEVEKQALLTAGEMTPAKMDELIAKYQQMQTAGAATYETLGAGVEMVYGDSVHTTVAEDLDKALMAQVDFAGRFFAKATYISGTIQTIFGEMGSAVEEQFGKMWIKLLEQTDTAVTAISKDLGSVAGYLTRLSEVQERVLKARKTIEDTPMAKPGGPLPPLGKMTPQEALRDAVHKPYWYYEDYRLKFDSLLTKVERLVQQGGVPVGAGPAEGTYTGAARRTPGVFEMEASGRL